MRKMVKKIVSTMLILALLLSCSTTVYGQTGGTVDPNGMDVIYDENMVNTLTNFATGRIGVSVEVPANGYVTVTAELNLNSRYGSIGRTVETFRNTENKTVSKRFYLTVGYLGEYRVTAECSKARTKYTDTDIIMSKMTSTVVTDKFVWDSANIAKYKRGEQVKATLSSSVGLVLSMAASNASGGGAVIMNVIEKAYSVTSTLIDIGTAGGVASMSTIDVTPIVGCGYQYRLTPTAKGFKKTLIVYDEFGRKYAEYDAGEYGQVGRYIKLEL